MRAFIVSNPHLLQAVVGFVFVMGRLMTAADTTELEEMLRDAVLAAFDDADLEIKDAAFHMGIDKEQLRRQLDPSVRNQYLSVLRLLLLPFAFWMSFGPRLIQIVYRRRMAQLRNRVEDRERVA